MGGGGGGAVTGRPPATPLGKITWALAAAFITTSIALTIIAAQNSAGSSVLDRITDAPARNAPAATELPDGADGLLPPSADGGEPLLPTAE